MSNKLDKPIGKLQVLENIFKIWTEQQNEGQDISLDQTSVSGQIPSTYLKSKKKDINQKIFMCVENSFKRYTKVVEGHARQCTEDLVVKRCTYRGHVMIFRLQCKSHITPHHFLWSSSPYMPNKEYLVNNGINHGLICSGMLPSHYTKFVDAAGIGKINKEERNSFFQRL